MRENFLTSASLERLNGMALMGPANRRQAMLEFQEEEILADQMFKIY